ncbi:gamma-butyrobetaine hydroxylase-like domain-containing protein [Undibacterium sp. RuRC25W]|uniref:gamma-butyrobetaine hydroxylase-like domain-containing protein n=1 Tax=Undibacterium sp. RuRC25W TaxID=3413047 RepID=UPI003BF28049
MSSNKVQPTSLNARTQSRVLEITFDDGKEFSIPFELMRVYSPSAEVKGHGPGQETLQTGKREVGLVGIKPVGNYAVKPLFSDAHDSGIFTWDYLYWLGDNQAQLWQDYVQRLQEAGFAGETGRDAPMPMKAGGCGHSH